MKRIITLFLTAVLFLSCNAYAFSDVKSDGELGVAVKALEEYGVINGYEDGSFRPDSFITRAEFCKMVNVLFNFTDVGVNDFTDVSYDDWYYRHVLIANEYEYINGFEDNTFRGDEKITREQASAIITRITPLLKIDDVVDITDDVSTWAKEDVQMIANHKLLKTETDGRFRAKENMTRGELAMLLSHFIPEAKTDSYEEGYQGTNAEIAIENAVVLANLKAAVRDIESVKFNSNEEKMVSLVLKGLNGTIDAGLNGQLINKHYVVNHFGKEIVEVRNIYKSMTDDEKGYFHNNLVKLNNSTLMFLTAYFLGDKPPV